MKTFHRNHLIPYTPKEEVIEPLILTYKLHNMIDSNITKLRKHIEPHIGLTEPSLLITPSQDNENEIIPNIYMI